MAKKKSGRRLPGTKAQRERTLREVHAADVGKSNDQKFAIAMSKVRKRGKRGGRK